MTEMTKQQQQVLNTMTPHQYPLLIHRVHSSFSLFQICYSPHQQWEIHLLPFLVYLLIRSFLLICNQSPISTPIVSHLEAILTPNKWFCASFFFWLHRTAHGILGPRPGVEPMSLALEVQSPNHQATMEVPISVSFLEILSLFIYLFGSTRSYLWHVGSSSLTRARTQAPCIVSMEP